MWCTLITFECSFYNWLWCIRMKLEITLIMAIACKLMYSYKNVQWTFIHPEWRWLSKIQSCWLCEPTLLNVNFVHLNYTVRRHNTIEKNLRHISCIILTPVAVSAYSVYNNCIFMEPNSSLWRKNFRGMHWLLRGTLLWNRIPLNKHFIIRLGRPM